ncbi:MAG: KH domain-containing protein, partial [Candidatus Thermoplasmatota archaeon]|nr:KH domain-containing protein [Candidatus Thermoplasmatota archaeon]
TSNKFTEKIQVDDKDIIEIINDYYQSSDLFTEIIIDSKLRTINIKTTKPGRVIGPKGKHLKSVIKAIKNKLSVVFTIHIVK